MLALVCQIFNLFQSIRYSSNSSHGLALIFISINNSAVAYALAQKFLFTGEKGRTGNTGCQYYRIRRIFTMRSTQHKAFAYLAQRNNFGLNDIYFHLLEMIYKNIHKRSTGNIGYTHIICNLRYTTQTGAEAVGFKQNNLTSLAGCSNRCRYAGRTTTNNGNIVIHKSILRTKKFRTYYNTLIVCFSRCIVKCFYASGDFLSFFEKST